MNCPKCNNKARIVETRKANNKVVRRHYCKKCAFDFITVENYMEGDKARALLKEGRDNVVRTRNTV